LVDSKKLLAILGILIIYVNYEMHFKEDVSKIQKNIVHIKQRIIREERLFKEKDKFKEQNSSKDYAYLFYDGEKMSYSTAMGIFQKDVQSAAKEHNCTVVTIQWQDMPQIKDRFYDTLSLRLSFEATPKDFIDFQNTLRKKSKFYIFNQINFYKDRRKNFLRISAILKAYRSKKNEK